MADNLDVICIGAALIDMVAMVERHPVEDDEVFVSDIKLLSGGAAANTTYACAKIGLKTAFIGKLGFNDTFGAKIVKDFKQVNVDTTLLKYSNEHGTGSAYVALNKEGDRRIYAHSGAANYLSKEDIIEEEVAATKVIFLSSLKNLEPFIEAAKLGKKHNIPIILNPGMLIIDQGFESIQALLKHLDILILSEREFTTLMNIQKEDIDSGNIKESIDKLIDLGIRTIVITRGKLGAALYTEDNNELIPPSEVIHVVDTTGAGDAFSAGFLYGFVKNLSFKYEDLRENIKIGNFIAAHCIQKIGARNGIPDEVAIKSKLAQN